MIRHLSLVAITTLALACGCVREFIEVNIQPRPDGSFVRTVRFWRIDDDKKGQTLAPDDDVLANAAKHYLTRLEDEGAAARFQGTFYHAVPADILFGGDTNHGGYTVWRSPLGHLGYYRERRPGRVDLLTRFREVEASIDVLVRMGTTIATQQLEGEAGLDKLVAYLTGPLHRDLKEAAFHFYVQRFRPRVPHDKNNEKDVLSTAAIVLQFAEERGHLKVKDLPKLGDDKARAELLMNMVAQRMGRPLDDALRKKLTFLGDPDLAKAAFEKALPIVGTTKERFEAAMMPVLNCVVAFEIFEVHPTLRYVLHLPPDARLRFTSGELDEKKRQITWKRKLEPRPVGDLFYALWSAPDAAWQTKRLGRVALRGEALEEYITWENALDPERAKAWRAALERLDPQRDLAADLKAAAGEGATMILAALKKAAKKQKPGP